MPGWRSRRATGLCRHCRCSMRAGIFCQQTNRCHMGPGLQGPGHVGLPNCALCACLTASPCLRQSEVQQMTHPCGPHQNHVSVHSAVVSHALTRDCHHGGTPSTGDLFELAWDAFRLCQARHSPVATFPPFAKVEALSALLSYHCKASSELLKACALRPFCIAHAGIDKASWRAPAPHWVE